MNILHGYIHALPHALHMDLPMPLGLVMGGTNATRVANLVISHPFPAVLDVEESMDGRPVRIVNALLGVSAWAADHRRVYVRVLLRVPDSLFLIEILRPEGRITYMSIMWPNISGKLYR